MQRRTWESHVRHYTEDLKNMVYKAFTLNLLFRLGLVVLNMAVISALFVYSDSTQMAFSFLFLVLLLIFQVYKLIQYINTTNRLLSGFLTDIRQRDFTAHYKTGNSNDSFKGLYQSFNYNE